MLQMFLKKNAIKHVVFALFDRIKGIGGRDTLYNIIRGGRWGLTRRMGHIGLMGPIGRGTGTNIVDGSNWEDWGLSLIHI